MAIDHFSESTGANFESDLQKARGYKPITQEEITNAYSQYSKQGIAFGQVTKQQSDQQLLQKSRDTVVAWWKAQKSDAAAATAALAAADAAAVATAKANADAVVAAQAAASAAASRAASTGGSSGGLPDTAMLPAGAPQPTYVPLPSITTGGHPLAASITTQEVAVAIKQMGLTNYFAASVPAKYRTNMATLNNYLAGVKKSRALAAASAAKVQAAYKIQHGFLKTNI